jgi:hypothetical protein
MIERLRGKADSFGTLEGSSPGCVMASIQDTIPPEAGRAGHVFTGVARELERANCLLVNTIRLRAPDSQ